MRFPLETQWNSNFSTLQLIDNHPAKKFISSRKKIYFFPQENLFSPAKKFIFSRKEIYLLPQENLFSTV